MPPSIHQVSKFTLFRRAIPAVAAVATILVVPELLRWYRVGEERTLSLTNIRRLSQGALLYAQDWDAATMPPPYEVQPGVWQSWPALLRPYVSPDSTFSNPSNPVIPFHSSLRDPIHDYAVNSSFAVNRRFWNCFGKGPFPLDNLELPEQTALFVEAGKMWKDPLKYSPWRPIGLLEYGDMEDRVGSYCPYPSTHDGLMSIVAADGHGIIVSVLHYRPKTGPHDEMYGRIGSNIYNWNGGHPNGQTDHPARE